MTGTNIGEAEANYETSTEAEATSSHQPEVREVNRKDITTKPSDKRVRTNKTTEAPVAQGKQKTPERRYNLRKR